MKFEAKREKTGGKRKKVHWIPTASLSCNTPDHAEKDIMTIPTSSQNIVFDCWEVSHALSKSACVPRASHFYFSIIFIFIKILNFPSFKLIIAKKPIMKKIKIPLDVNLVITFCNQSGKRPKSPWTLFLVFLLLRIFKSFNCASKIQKDQFIFNQYNTDKWTIRKKIILIPINS